MTGIQRLMALLVGELLPNLATAVTYGLSASFAAQKATVP